jgi:hypothetical protein
LITSYPMPTNPSNNPFYNPAFDYWRGNEFPLPRELTATQWEYGEQNPEAAWTRYLAELGFGGMNTKGAWARGLYGRAGEGFQAARQRNEVLDWQDYLATLNIPQMYAQLTPGEKGYNDAQFGGPVRWQRRV